MKNLIQEKETELKKAVEFPSGNPANDESQAKLKTKLAERKFNFHKPPPKPVACLTLDDKPISTAGNITNIQAGVKAGKTAVVGAVVGALLRGNRQGGECLGFNADNPNGLAVVHFDTEQSFYDADQVMRKAMIRAVVDEPPAWLFSYSLADVDTLERREAIRLAIAEAGESCGGVHAVILDGVADFCADPNDPAEAFALVAEIHRIAIKHDCPVVTVLHENPGSETGKTRGHLGSQLERKAETNLRLFKDGDGITTIYTERARHCHIPKGEGVCFAWNHQAGMHTACGNAGEIEAAAKRDRMTAEAVKVMTQGPLTYSELVDAITDTLDLKERAAKGRITSWKNEGVIRKSDTGKFHLSDDK